MKVADLMTKDVFTSSPEETLERVAHTMWVGDCGCIPVVDRDSRRVVGIVTDRDVCMAAYTQGRRLGEIPVATAMSHVVHGCGPDDSLAAAEHAMRAYRVRRLPVVTDDGHLLGMLSLTDLAREAHRQRSRTSRAAVTPLGLTETLATIAAPRTSENDAPAARADDRNAAAPG
jgi:CBS domain-containing protein